MDRRHVSQRAESARQKGGLNRRGLLSGLAMLPMVSSLVAVRNAAAQQTNSGFSFAVCGDSRPMMYLPVKEGHTDLVELFVEMFGLVMPEKVAEAVVKRDVKMIFDPVTKELRQVVMPFMSRSEVMTLSVDQGWVTRASVEDVKLLPGVHRDIFQLEGGDWVSREVVQHVQNGRAKFVVNSGDVVWWGNQGRGVSDSPYWKRVNETVLQRLPAPDAEMRAAGVGGVAMEVSSHALALSRVDELQFDVAVFTNLTQDHLDFHGSLEDYRGAKRRLFELLAASPKPRRTAAWPCATIAVTSSRM